MGVTLSSIFSRLFGREEMRIIMVGLDATGKTTILYKLKLGTVVTSIPTIGFNVESIIHKNIKFTIWDVAGGCDLSRPLWRHYYPDTRAVIFVVDSSDPIRIEEAESALKCVIQDEQLDNAILLVLGNKQDIPNAMTSSEITEKLKLNELLHHRWHLQMTSAIKGEGLQEALDWLANELTVG